MRETWYKLEDGRLADPADIVTRDDGWLTHTDGVAVAAKSLGVPWTWSVDPDEERAKAAKASKDAKPEVTREMDADKPKRAYVRRSKDD